MRIIKWIEDDLHISNRQYRRPIIEELQYGDIVEIVDQNNEHLFDRGCKWNKYRCVLFPRDNGHNSYIFVTLSFDQHEWSDREHVHLYTKTKLFDKIACGHMRMKINNKQKLGGQNPMKREVTNNLKEHLNAGRTLELIVEGMDVSIRKTEAKGLEIYVNGVSYINIDKDHHWRHLEKETQAELDYLLGKYDRTSEEVKSAMYDPKNGENNQIDSKGVTEYSSEEKFKNSIQKVELKKEDTKILELPKKKMVKRTTVPKGFFKKIRNGKKVDFKHRDCIAPKVQQRSHRAKAKKEQKHQIVIHPTISKGKVKEPLVCIKSTKSNKCWRITKQRAEHIIFDCGFNQWFKFIPKKEWKEWLAKQQPEKKKIVYKPVGAIKNRKINRSLTKVLFEDFVSHKDINGTDTVQIIRREPVYVTKVIDISTKHPTYQFGKLAGQPNPNFGKTRAKKIKIVSRDDNGKIIYKDIVTNTVSAEGRGIIKRKTHFYKEVDDANQHRKISPKELELRKIAAEKQSTLAKKELSKKRFKKPIFDKATGTTKVKERYVVPSITKTNYSIEYEYVKPNTETTVKGTMSVTAKRSDIAQKHVLYSLYNKFKKESKTNEIKVNILSRSEVENKKQTKQIVKPEIKKIEKSVILKDGSKLSSTRYKIVRKKTPKTTTKVKLWKPVMDEKKAKKSLLKQI